jgi:aldehyde dehydrogenase (NAD+)
MAISRQHLFIGGEWVVPATGARIEVINAATGTIGVNGYVIDFAAPFGGVKQSGLGREFGPEALTAYQQLKSIYLPG